MNNQSLLERWIYALRSGYYKQIKPELTYRRKDIRGGDTHHCAVGVLGEVCEGVSWSSFSTGRHLVSGPTFRRDVFTKLGMTATDVTEVSWLFECAGRSFTDLANHLEKHYLRREHRGKGTNHGSLRLFGHGLGAITSRLRGRQVAIHSVI